MGDQHARQVVLQVLPIEITQDTSENEQDYSQHVVTIDGLGSRQKFESTIDLIFGGKKAINDRLQDKTETK